MPQKVPGPESAQDKSAWTGTMIDFASRVAGTVFARDVFNSREFPSVSKHTPHMQRSCFGVPAGGAWTHVPCRHIEVLSWCSGTHPAGRPKGARARRTPVAGLAT